MTDTVRQFLLDYKTKFCDAGRMWRLILLLPALGKQSRGLSEFEATWST